MANPQPPQRAQSPWRAKYGSVAPYFDTPRMGNISHSGLAPTMPACVQPFGIDWALPNVPYPRTPNSSIWLDNIFYAEEEQVQANCGIKGWQPGGGGGGGDDDDDDVEEEEYSGRMTRSMARGKRKGAAKEGRPAKRRRGAGPAAAAAHPAPISPFRFVEVKEDLWHPVFRKNRWYDWKHPIDDRAGQPIQPPQEWSVDYPELWKELRICIEMADKFLEASLHADWLHHVLFSPRTKEEHDRDDLGPGFQFQKQDFDQMPYRIQIAPDGDGDGEGEVEVEVEAVDDDGMDVDVNGEDADEAEHAGDQMDVDVGKGEGEGKDEANKKYNDSRQRIEDYTKYIVWSFYNFDDAAGWSNIMGPDEWQTRGVTEYEKNKNGIPEGLEHENFVSIMLSTALLRPLLELPNSREGVAERCIIRYQVANLLVHELMHAIHRVMFILDYEHISACEPLYGAENAAELGSSWEQAHFGGSINPAPYLEMQAHAAGYVLTSRPWPAAAIHAEPFSILDYDDDGKRTTEWTISLLPTLWASNFASQDYWDAEYARYGVGAMKVTPVLQASHTLARGGPGQTKEATNEDLRPPGLNVALQSVHDDLAMRKDRLDHLRPWFESELSVWSRSPFEWIMFRTALDRFSEAVAIRDEAAASAAYGTVAIWLNSVRTYPAEMRSRALYRALSEMMDAARPFRDKPHTTDDNRPSTIDVQYRPSQAARASGVPWEFTSPLSRTLRPEGRPLIPQDVPEKHNTPPRKARLILLDRAGRAIERARDYRPNMADSTLLQRVAELQIHLRGEVEDYERDDEWLSWNFSFPDYRTSEADPYDNLEPDDDESAGDRAGESEEGGDDETNDANDNDNDNNHNDNGNNDNDNDSDLPLESSSSSGSGSGGDHQESYGIRKRRELKGREQPSDTLPGGRRVKYWTISEVAGHWSPQGRWVIVETRGHHGYDVFSIPDSAMSKKPFQSLASFERQVVHTPYGRKIDTLKNSLLVRAIRGSAFVGRLLLPRPHADVEEMNGLDGRPKWIYFGQDVYDITEFAFADANEGRYLKGPHGGNVAMSLYDRCSTIDVPDLLKRLAPYRCATIKPPLPNPLPRPRSQLPVYTMREVSRHVYRETRVWVVIERLVHDFTDYADHHPGISDIIWQCAGQDATGIFFGNHGNRASADAILRNVAHLRVGRVVEEHIEAHGLHAFEIRIGNYVYNYKRLVESQAGRAQWGGLGTYSQQDATAHADARQHGAGPELLRALQQRRDLISGKIRRAIKNVVPRDELARHNRLRSLRHLLADWPSVWGSFEEPPSAEAYRGGGDVWGQGAAAGGGPGQLPPRTFDPGDVISDSVYVSLEGLVYNVTDMMRYGDDDTHNDLAQFAGAEIDRWLAYQLEVENKCPIVGRLGPQSRYTSQEEKRSEDEKRGWPKKQSRRREDVKYRRLKRDNKRRRMARHNTLKIGSGSCGTVRRINVRPELEREYREKLDDEAQGMAGVSGEEPTDESGDMIVV
ncbi:hypothetical protein B0T24DRAFT_705189 [Lasiosphaeria ovina]|uniref:Cytochrome b5 heme-binding domain-containing protein n=1 Tax=Lasiosphaeria ovina TaxID=92902 RepID=A0AAE0N5B4_9PEZI|nr:hypothetical protein B0T24DRAFT_705189 [Lasiosphaeria ovina]